MDKSILTILQKMLTSTAKRRLFRKRLYSFQFPIEVIKSKYKIIKKEVSRVKNSLLTRPLPNLRKLFLIKYGDLKKNWPNSRS